MTWLTQVLLLTQMNQMRCKVFIIHELDEIEKTQLFVEFTQQHQRSYSAIFWVNDSINERLRRSIIDLVSRLSQHQISEESRNYLHRERTNVDEVVEDVLKWFSQSLNNQWLLIFDNVNREFLNSSRDSKVFDVKEYFSTADQESILITSWLMSLYQLKTNLRLKSINKLQESSILENSLEWSMKDECHWSILFQLLSDIWDSLDSSKLVDLLEDLSLMINQVDLYMRKTDTNLSEYIKLYNQAWTRLMRKQHHFTLSEDEDSILTTWTLSYNSLQLQSENAVNLLKLWAFLDNQNLWYELLTSTLNLQTVNKVSRWFISCADYKIDFNECIELLLKYFFIDAKTESSSFSMHSVLYHWCFHAFEEDEITMSWLVMIIVAFAVSSKIILDYSLIQRHLFSHCDHVYSRLQQRIHEDLMNEKDLSSLSDVYHWLELLYLNQNKMKKVENMYLRALTEYEKIWDSEHTLMLNMINNLRTLYKNQDKMKKVEDMFLQALTEKKKIWDSEHTSMLDMINNLKNLYKNQNKMKEVENMYLQALTKYEKTWDSEHTSTLKIINNLENLYKNQDKMKEVEDMYQRAKTKKS